MQASNSKGQRTRVPGVVGAEELAVNCAPALALPDINLRAGGRAGRNVSRQQRQSINTSACEELWHVPLPDTHNPTAQHIAGMQHPGQPECNSRGARTENTALPFFSVLLVLAGSSPTTRRTRGSALYRRLQGQAGGPVWGRSRCGEAGARGRAA